MSSDDFNKREELAVDLDDHSSDNSISERLKEFKNAGKVKVNLEIKSSYEYGITYLELDSELFTKIKEIQDLPDWVIVKLILAEGRLKRSSFKERVPND